MIHRKGTSLSLRYPSAVTRPTARPATAAPASKAARQPASSAAAGGLLTALVGWAALFALLVVMPIAMLANGVDPGAVLGWMAMVAVSLAVSWWLEGRRQAAEPRNLPKPRRATSPCVEKGNTTQGVEVTTPAEAILSTIAEIIGFTVLGFVALLVVVTVVVTTHDPCFPKYDRWLYDDNRRWNRRQRKRK